MKAITVTDEPVYKLTGCKVIDSDMTRPTAYNYEGGELLYIPVALVEWVKAVHGQLMTSEGRIMIPKCMCPVYFELHLVNGENVTVINDERTTPLCQRYQINFAPVILSGK